ncbi:MAG: 2-hydroxyacyl-CoA dehydratase [Candidatus Zixiibacteriota bacterium]|nr:MAG: 2-hydroxyacyl-CoA dehydratase [candidate division Zixibacteria bacterium]
MEVLPPRIELLTILDRLAREYRELPRSRPVVGTICLGAPVELAEAVGAVPVRLLSAGLEDELRGGRFLASDTCSFCKSLLGGLHRTADPPDAVLGATTCDQMRRSLEIVARDLGRPVFTFNAPRTMENPLARDFAREELRRLAAKLAAWSGVPFDAARLREALLRRREIQRRMRDLADREIEGRPALSGGEFLALARLFLTTPADYFASCLPEIEAWVQDRGSPYRRPPLRLALLGSCLGDGDGQIVDLAEENGRAAIVYDALCTGRRALGDAGPLPDDSFEALLTVRHDEILCPHRRPNDRLLETVARDLQRRGVQGVIFKTLKFCHPWGFEAVRFKEALGLPFLHLDHDLSNNAAGQMRTRVHAFLEQLLLRR